MHAILVAAMQKYSITNHMHVANTKIQFHHFEQQRRCEHVSGDDVLPSHVHLSNAHTIKKTEWHSTLAVSTGVWKNTFNPSKKWKSYENKTHRLWRRLFLTRFFPVLMWREMWLHTIWFLVIQQQQYSTVVVAAITEIKLMAKKDKKWKRIKMSLFKCNEIMPEHRISINLSDLKLDVCDCEFKRIAI